MNMEERSTGMHQRIYPHTEVVVQYATDQGPDIGPWIVRDRQSALRNERQGRGRALVRTWIPSDWYEVNFESGSEENN